MANDRIATYARRRYEIHLGHAVRAFQRRTYGEEGSGTFRSREDEDFAKRAVNKLVPDVLSGRAVLDDLIKKWNKFKMRGIRREGFVM